MRVRGWVRPRQVWPAPFPRVAPLDSVSGVGAGARSRRVHVLAATNERSPMMFWKLVYRVRERVQPGDALLALVALIALAVLAEAMGVKL